MAGFVTAAWVVAGALTHSAIEQGKARRDQKRAREQQQKADKLTTQKSAVESIRQSQIAAANVTQAGVNQGVSGSSAVAGAVGSIASQEGGNQAFAQQIFSIQQSKNRLMESAYGHLGNAANFSAVASIATTALGAKGSIE